MPRLNWPILSALMVSGCCWAAIAGVCEVALH